MLSSPKLSLGNLADFTGLRSVYCLNAKIWTTFARYDCGMLLPPPRQNDWAQESVKKGREQWSGT